MKDLYLIGGGGHCASVIDVIEQQQKYKIKGLFDLPKNVGTSVLGYKIIGTDEDIKKYITNESFFFISLGQIKTADHRKRLVGIVKSLGGKFACVISPKAYISKYSQIKSGSFIGHEAFVDAGCSIGFHCIINTGACLCSNVSVNDFCHISTCSVIESGCSIGSSSFVGSKSLISYNTVIDPFSLIGAGKRV